MMASGSGETSRCKSQASTAPERPPPMPSRSDCEDGGILSRRKGLDGNSWSRGAPRDANGGAPSDVVRARGDAVQGSFRPGPGLT